MNDARDLLTPTEFAGVAATVLRNNRDMDPVVAERITAEALKFLAAAAHSPGQGLRPSRIVDEGWHALILHTKVYANLCTQLGGFIHHVPEPPDSTRYNPGALERTQGAISEAGFEPGPMLWLAPGDPSILVAASCQHSPGGPGVVHRELRSQRRELIGSPAATPPWAVASFTGRRRAAWASGLIRSRRWCGAPTVRSGNSMATTARSVAGSGASGGTTAS